MKKAKMFLAAVAVIGLVAGAFAFKAQKFGSASYFTCKTTVTPKVCTTSVPTEYTGFSTIESTNFPHELTNATTVSGQSCQATSSCGILYGSLSLQ